jgi:hypothetical protein
MKFLMKKLRAMHEENRAALETNKVILEAAERQGETAEALRDHAERQATKLRRADGRNHYSESLTHAFRGRPAQ